MSENPFGVQNPEHVDAKYIASHFVEVLTDFPRLKEMGNTFVHGARGTGKSMLLRSLEPAVMLLRGQAASKLDELPFLAVHVPLRKADFGAPEIGRFKGYTATAIGEHLLVMHVMLRLAEMLESLADHISGDDAKAFSDRFQELYYIAGGALESLAEPGHYNSAEIFRRVVRTCERDIFGVRQYLVRGPFKGYEGDYLGALAGFLDFLVPLATELRKVHGLPSVPLFVMLDDADNLPIPMQRVLNSWVSSRSTDSICLKITTQLAYATLRTVDNRVIESPHDFAEVNLTAVYTSSGDIYSGRIREIVAKRLINAGIEVDVDDFFPTDTAQSERIRQIELEIEAKHEVRATTQGGGAARVRDERRRYAVPTFMRELSGTSRSAHTFSYAGFGSLVDLSSGVVRWFLEPASRMYDRVVSKGEGDVTSIPVAIQDEVIRAWSTEFLEPLRRSDEAPSIRLNDVSDDGNASEESLHALGHETLMYGRLRNLIEGLGRVFRARLLDETASEQRLFSIILRDQPSKELLETLNLGVRLGYLQQADNAAKEALGGRRPRFILARRLGPYYRLDVSGYAGHLSVMASDLEIALRSPSEFVKARLSNDDRNDAQTSLNFDGGQSEAADL